MKTLFSWYFNTFERLFTLLYLPLLFDPELLEVGEWERHVRVIKKCRSIQSIEASMCVTRKRGSNHRNQSRKLSRAFHDVFPSLIAESSLESLSSKSSFQFACHRNIMTQKWLSFIIFSLVLLTTHLIWQKRKRRTRIMTLQSSFFLQSFRGKNNHSAT